MKKLLKLIFPTNNESCTTSFVLLATRVIFALLLAHHGLQKYMAFDQMSSAFPDPLGVGSQTSLILAIFAELVCSVALILGVLSRLVLIPMIFTMAVAFFIANGGSIEQGELAFAYLIVFTLLLIAGPGKFSVDGYLVSLCPAMNKEKCNCKG